jgi:PAS domain S-box-containing protein
MREKILLVDDREDNLLAICAILEPDGYQFVKANSGREALKVLLSEYDFALILMDVKMPNLNGFETATLIYEREKLRNIPVIFITAHSYDEENIFEGFKTGAVDYIYKPINPNLLRAKVCVFIDLYRKNRALITQERKLTTINNNLEAEIIERRNSESQLAELYKSLQLKNSELKQANHELLQAREALADDRTRFLIRAMPHMVALIKPDGALEYSNERFLDFTGLPFPNIMGNKWIETIYPDDRDKFLFQWKEALATGEKLQIEFRMRRADGQYFWHLGLMKPYHDENNSVSMWIVTLTDIHDQKMLDEKKDEFIAMASHELKTPLTTAKGYNDLLMDIVDENTNVEIATYARKTNVSINRLNKLISDLLDITKIQHGKFQLKIVEFDIDNTLNEAIESIQQAFPKSNIRKMNEDDFWVKGDRERILQVCVNLLNNAIKYSPNSNDVDIKVSGKGNDVEVAITDYGIGIPKSGIDKLFSRFYRVEGNAQQFPGLGIGLFIASEIIKQHHGEIRVVSDVGRGSTFYFTLPIGIKKEKGLKAIVSTGMKNNRLSV